MNAAIGETAMRAARLWGDPAGPPRLIAHRENAVFELRLRDGRRGALRLHRAGYRGDAEIRSELIWTEAIAAAGFPCPAPLRSGAGTLLERLPCGVRASLTGWVEGAPFAPVSPTEFHALGARIAWMHAKSDALALPEGFTRPSWSAEALLGETPTWGRFWENPSLSARDASFLEALRPELRQALTAQEPGDGGWGLIHADLLGGNVLCGPEGLSIIDFDDGGWGWRCYDLGTALIDSVGAPDFADRAAALAEGYGLHERRGGLALFVLLRALASAGWVMSRTAPGDPRQRVYAQRALLCARRYAGEGIPGSKLAE